VSDKVTDVASAVRRYVRSGDTLFLAGMQHGESAAAVREILRQDIGDLTLIPQLPLTGELLLTEGRVRRLLAAYVSSLDTRRGFLGQKMAGQARFELVEFSHGSLHTALLGGQLGVPFTVTTALLGSDYPTVNPDFFTVTTSPFDGTPVVAVRSLRPDVAIIHVQEADADGNARKVGSLGMDVAGVSAADRVIVTCERIVDAAVLRSTPNLTTIPGLLVDAVVEVPFGAWPQHLFGEYDGDFRTWQSMTADEQSYDRFMAELVRGVETNDEFLRAVRNRFGDVYLDRLRDRATAPNEALAARLAALA
jgi:glutaconate CoA-transferase, subunit A